MKDALKSANRKARGDQRQAEGLTAYDPRRTRAFVRTVKCGKRLRSPFLLGGDVRYRQRVGADFLVVRSRISTGGGDVVSAGRGRGVVDPALVERRMNPVIVRRA